VISIDDLQFFTTVARSPSLVAAAKNLNVTAPAVSQRLRGLESRLQTRLVLRNSKLMALTDEGELLARRGRELLMEIEELDDAIADRREIPSGHLQVLAPTSFGRRYIAPLLDQMIRTNDQLTIQLTLTDRPNCRERDRWDVAIHIGDLPDSSLSMVRLAPNDRILCASPAYLRGRRALQRPEDLMEHDCICRRETDQDGGPWRFTGADGSTDQMRIKARLSSNDGATIKQWALSGLGVIARSEWDVAEEIASGRLVRVLPGYSLPSADVVALMPPGPSRRTKRTQHFLQRVREAFQPVPWRVPTQSPFSRS
jgi:DNA-binding transcriptional LysR family regulator